MSKENNYDNTASQRMRNREQRIKYAGFSNLKVVMHKDDAEAVRKLAQELYEKRGIKLN